MGVPPPTMVVMPTDGLNVPRAVTTVPVAVLRLSADWTTVDEVANCVFWRESSKKKKKGESKRKRDQHQKHQRRICDPGVVFNAR